MLCKQPQATPKAAGAKTEILDIIQPQERGLLCLSDNAVSKHSS